MQPIMTIAAKTPKSAPGIQQNKIVPTTTHNISFIFSFLVNSYQYIIFKL